MFRHEGPARDPRANTVLAGYLAAIAGFVNSGGFVMIGSFTSHVTGSVGRMSDDIARGQMPAAASALSLIAAFFAGAFLASLVLEQSDGSRPASRYAFALLHLPTAREANDKLKDRRRAAAPLGAGWCGPRAPWP